jgi:Zn-dependent protease
MAWQDRPYYRDGSTSNNPLMWLLSGSVPLFTAFNIRVRAHASLILLIALMLLTSGMSGGIGVRNAITFSTILFGIILLHEFGHCFAARSVGGDANDILMWPLGGLAFADAPMRAWPQFFTALGGPLVNVVICILTGIGMAAVNWKHPNVPWNPLSRQFSIPYGSAVGYYLWWIFIISWGNLLFNLLPVYPLDGGRLLQGGLWFKLGYYKATIIACNVGLVGSVLMGMWGIVNFTSWYGLVLIAIAISSFFFCVQLRAVTRAAGPWGVEQDDGIDYSAAYEIDPERKQKKVDRWSVRRAAKRSQRIAREEQAEKVKIDAILAKVSAHGIQSLTWLEKRALHKATEHQRQRDQAARGRHAT